MSVPGSTEVRAKDGILRCVHWGCLAIQGLSRANYVDGTGTCQWSEVGPEPDSPHWEEDDARHALRNAMDHLEVALQISEAESTRSVHSGPIGRFTREFTRVGDAIRYTTGAANAILLAKFMIFTLSYPTLSYLRSQCATPIHAFLGFGKCGGTFVRVKICPSQHRQEILGIESKPNNR
jgi:hypothetical protein